MRCEFINCSSCGIVVASTSIPSTFVFGGLAARPTGAAAPDAPRARATSAAAVPSLRNLPRSIPCDCSSLMSCLPTSGWTFAVPVPRIGTSGLHTHSRSQVNLEVAAPEQEAQREEGEPGEVGRELQPALLVLQHLGRAVAERAAGVLREP